MKCNIAIESNKVPVKNILAGECFVYRDDLYMVINAGPRIIRYANLETGAAIDLDSEEMVLPVEAEVTVIREKRGE